MIQGLLLDFFFSPVLTSNGRSNSRRASFLSGRFSSSTAPEDINEREIKIPSYALNSNSCCVINLDEARAAGLNNKTFITFKKFNGELICVQIADIFS